MKGEPGITHKQPTLLTFRVDNLHLLQEPAILLLYTIMLENKRTNGESIVRVQKYESLLGQGIIIIINTNINNSPKLNYTMCINIFSPQIHLCHNANNHKIYNNIDTEVLPLSYPNLQFITSLILKQPNCNAIFTKCCCNVCNHKILHEFKNEKEITTKYKVFAIIRNKILNISKRISGWFKSYFAKACLWLISKSFLINVQIDDKIYINQVYHENKHVIAVFKKNILLIKAPQKTH